MGDFSLASFTIAVISAVFVVDMVTDFLTQVHHKFEMIVLIALNLSILYSILLLRKFQRNILEYVGENVKRPRMLLKYYFEIS